jgi:hypothetical protein
VYVERLYAGLIERAANRLKTEPSMPAKAIDDFDRKRKQRCQPKWKAGFGQEKPS